MSNTFASLKRDRSESLNKLTNELSKLNQPQQSNNNSSGDDRFWKPTVDKAGNGQAIIRFLPPSVNEDMPFVRLWDHGFQGPGGWYIEKSLTTLSEKDPVSELNTRLWNSGVESDKELVRKQKRRLHYISNIYVVKDPANPDTEGKVFLFQYGKKIFDKISDAMNPEFDGEEKINPFDFWEGANFKLKIRNVESYRNYDKSEFDSISSISEDDSEIETIWAKQHSLQQFLDPKHFKSYEDLKKKFDMVMGLTGGMAPVKKAEDTYLEEEDFTPKATAPKVEKKVEKAPAKEVDFDNDDESLSYFAKLAED